MTDKSNKNNKNQTGASLSSDQLGENASEEYPDKYSQKATKSDNTRGTRK